MTRTSDPSAPRGIAGWLLLPAAFVLLSPVYVGWRLLRNARTAAAMLGEDTPFTTGLLVAVEFAVTAAMLAASFWLIYLLAKRRAAFVETYISFMYAGVVMALVGLATTIAVLGSEVDALLYPLDLMDLRGLIASVAWAAVFIPYMHRSRRVKATFVSPPSPSGEGGA